MTSMNEFWKNWAPYWSDNEDFFLGLDSIRRLEKEISSPALVVGAGQGLLVERLRLDGFQTDGVDSELAMIAYAKKRRGLDIIHADARKMPFGDRSYASVIIASGVLDVLEEEAAIREILDEAFRVSEPAGKVFVAFQRFGDELERLIEETGGFADGAQPGDRYYCMRKTTQANFESPALFYRMMKTVGMGSWAALWALAKVRFLLPRREKARLLQCVPETVPYRGEDGIRRLLETLDLRFEKVHRLDGCTIVEIVA